jgi:hypothetical protein
LFISSINKVLSGIDERAKYMAFLEYYVGEGNKEIKK